MLALCLAWLAATAWMRPLMLPDEGRYAAVAWEMLRSGDWLTPTLDGLPFFHKPPLFYWITGAALALAGPVELAARAASIVGAVLAAWPLYLFTRRWCDAALARRVLLLLLVQPLFFVGAQFANLDMLVAGCITATVLALAHAALCFEQGLAHRRTLMLAYGLAALGVLAKGLIGFVLPAMIVGLWLLLRGRWRTLLALLSLPGLALFLAVAGPWFWAMQQRFGDFLHYFFVVQHFQRFAAGGFNNAQPFWFYPVVLVLCSLPALLWLRGALARGYLAAPGVQGSVRLLMALALGSVLLFFSLPQSKLIGYILPAVPALAWLMADASLQAEETPARRRRWWLTLACGAVLGLAPVIGLSVDQRHSTRDLALVLRAQHHSGEPVFMLRGYWYDVPFYARLREPVLVVGDWNDAAIAQHDNWRKEVADAAAFDPPLARHLLLRPQAWRQALCRAGGAWVIGTEQSAQQLGLPAQARAVYAARGVTLWHVPDGKGQQAPCS
ncbi:MAG: glycosyltransferase family 39 protein [Proteobacteria bacterium]|nr:glycosyltransferase family 39 protein [Pseudomonadota bacterium]MBS0492951.1 glycosyltransferase family 39 protein [Pseudomonadota bacterium]